MSIRARITLLGIGVLSALLALLCLAVYGLLSSGVRKDQDKALAERAGRAVASLAAAAPADLDRAAAGTVLTPVDPRSSTEIFVVVLDGAGAVLASGGVVDGRAPVVPRDLLDAASVRDGALATVEAAPGLALRVYVLPWHRADLGRSGFVAAWQSLGRVEADRRATVVIVVLYAILGLLVGAPAIWLVVGRALRPLRQLAGLADEIGRSRDLARRLPPVAARDDLGRLTTSFNTMMERLQSAFAAQQRFVADASHELRTPLTTIRGNAGFLLRHSDAAPADRAAAVRDIVGESDRMSRLVDNLLVLARADAGRPLGRVPVDLAAIVEQVCRQARSLHPDREIHCAVTPIPPVSGDVDALAQLAWIMIDNAVKYTSSGGTVWVAVTQRADLAQLHVSDDGCGIPPADLERVFARFYRVDPARAGGGAGLGLAIASWIVAAHGGTIAAANNARGGAAFVAELPLRAGPPAPAEPPPGSPASGFSSSS